MPGDEGESAGQDAAKQPGKGHHQPDRLLKRDLGLVIQVAVVVDARAWLKGCVGRQRVAGGIDGGAADADQVAGAGDRRDVGDAERAGRDVLAADANVVHEDFGGARDRRQAADRQTVPRSEYLLVAPGADARVAGFENQWNLWVYPAGGDEPDPKINEKFAHKLQFIEELEALQAYYGDDLLPRWSSPASTSGAPPASSPIEASRRQSPPIDGPWFL